MVKKLLLAILLLALSGQIVLAQSSGTLINPKQEFYRGIVAKIINQGQTKDNGQINYYQTLEVKIEGGALNGKSVLVDNGKENQISKSQLVTLGQEIIVSKTTDQSNNTFYSVYDFYRLNSLIVFIFIFFAGIIIIAGIKGIGSILGMLVSLTVILFYIVPNILKGNDPLTVTLTGSVVIIFISTYLAHGISKKTSVALLSTLITLFLTAAFANLSMSMNNVTGLGNEDFYSLQLGPTSTINIQGLFLSAIIIGTLGALNDITTTQSATILELKKTDPKLKFIDLLEKGFYVGKEHIASLVNTLILAYVGSAFAVFIFFVLNPAHLPYWVILNNEIISDEAIKIIAGSIGLLLSVPIVTFIASVVYSKEPTPKIKH